MMIKTGGKTHLQNERGHLIRLILARGSSLNYDLSSSTEGNVCTRHVAPSRPAQSKVNKTIRERSEFNLFKKFLNLHHVKKNP